jgi:hypothetical protein
MRVRVALCGLLAATYANAAASDRDKAWDALIAEAKARGGAETKLDRSTSYVFKREDGSFVSLTQLIPPKVKRAVCLIAMSQDATLCVDWDDGKVTLGDRADAATPWKTRNVASLDELEASQPGVFDTLLSTINKIIGGGGRHGYFRNSNGRSVWVNRN